MVNLLCQIEPIFKNLLSTHFPKMKPSQTFTTTLIFLIPYNAFHTLHPGTKLQIILTVVSFITESTR